MKSLKKKMENMFPIILNENRNYQVVIGTNCEIIPHHKLLLYIEIASTCRKEIKIKLID